MRLNINHFSVLCLLKWWKLGCSRKLALTLLNSHVTTFHWAVLTPEVSTHCLFLSGSLLMGFLKIRCLHPEILRCFSGVFSDAQNIEGKKSGIFPAPPHSPQKTVVISNWATKCPICGYSPTPCSVPRDITIKLRFQQFFWPLFKLKWKILTFGPQRTHLVGWVRSGAGNTLKVFICFLFLCILSIFKD